MGPSIFAVLAFSVSAFFFVGPLAWAFPENVRHGYVNCTACHASPTGGGLLTAYGRELSREIQSTWGAEGEQRFLYGAVKPPEWLNLGGDYRSVYWYRDTPAVRQGQYQFMQADLEASVTSGKLTLLSTVGYRETDAQRAAAAAGRPNTADEDAFDHLISRRHFALYQATDELSVRFGRFYPAYGILLPDHVVSTRRGLGWDQSRESYNFETAWLGETLNLYGTLIRGRPDEPGIDISTGGRETGWAVSSWIPLLDTYKVGASFLRGFNARSDRTVFGAHGILGFTSRFYLLTELDLQFVDLAQASAADTSGAVNYQKLGYEAVQGLHFYVTQEVQRLDFKQDSSLALLYGIGAQWFPRPHIEVNLNWQKQKLGSLPDATTDFAWFLFHYYL